MDIQFDTRDATSLRGRQIGTQVVFFVAGFGRASWAPLVPFLKARIGLDDGQLGLLLLCLGAGSMLGMPFSGLWNAKLGCRRVIIFSVVALAVALTGLGVVGNYLFAGILLLLYGISAGTVDVAMNVQAIEVERDCERAVMSGFHAFYSLGGIVGAAGGSVLLTLGLSPGAVAILAASLIVAAPASIRRSLISARSPAPSSLLAIPKGAIVLVSALTFVVFLTESAVLDWSGVFLTAVREMNRAYSGYGYAAFAGMMTIGRLVGDEIVRGVGRIRVVIFGSVIASLGLIIVATVPSWEVGLIGYALIGIGCSNIAPVLFSSLARQRAMPTNEAVASMTTVGYAGIFVGPAVIGAMANLSSIQSAFIAVAASLVLVAAIAKPVLRLF